MSNATKALQTKPHLMAYAENNGWFRYSDVNGNDERFGRCVGVEVHDTFGTSISIQWNDHEAPVKYSPAQLMSSNARGGLKYEPITEVEAFKMASRYLVLENEAFDALFEARGEMASELCEEHGIELPWDLPAAATEKLDARFDTDAASESLFLAREAFVGAMEAVLDSEARPEELDALAGLLEEATFCHVTQDKIARTIASM